MAAVAREVLFTARTTDASSSTMTMVPGFRDYTYIVTGTFNGATMTLQASHDNTNWVAVGSSTTVTAVACVNFQTAAPYIRATQSASGGSTSLNVWVGS